MFAGLRNRQFTHLFSAVLLLGSSAFSAAATLHVPGYVEVNQYSLPAGVPSPLGDVMFSDDGNTLYIVGGSSTFGSEVWTVPVIRDAAGAVTGLGSATRLMAFPNIDTGLEHRPGTDSLVFRGNSGVVGQMLADGSVVTSTAAGASYNGGLAFVPEALPNAGDLLVGNYNSGVINSYAPTDNADGSFTPVLTGFYSNSAFGATGDLEFVPSGDFENDLMYTNWNGGTVSIIDIDPLSGNPVGGGTAPPVTLFASDLGTGPWGLAFDPVTNDLFIANFTGNPYDGIVQISGFPPPVAKNEPPSAACQDVTVPTDTGMCTASVASVDAGSADPDGDAITLTQDPAGPYPLGGTPVTLTAADANGGLGSCSAVVTVVDQEPPTITASLARISGNRWWQWRRMGRYVVRFGAEDNCGLTSPTTAVLNAPGCAPIPVADGAILELRSTKHSGSCRVSYKRGVLRIWGAGSLTLEVTAEDASGFATASVQADFPDPRRRFTFRDRPRGNDADSDSDSDSDKKRLMKRMLAKRR